MTSEAAFTIKALYKCYMNHFENAHFHLSINGPMDSAFASHLGDPGSIPGWGIIETLSKFPNFSF